MAPFSRATRRGLLTAAIVPFIGDKYREVPLTVDLKPDGSER